MIKTILTLVSLLITSHLSANSSTKAIQLSEEAAYIIPLTDFSIADQIPLCPEQGTCIVDGTRLTIEVQLDGCFDQLGPVRVVTIDNTVYIGADNIGDNRSLAALCSPLPVETFTISLINKFGDFEVKPMPIVQF